MNILVIGNGFDLAHDLPTTYKDFLEWVNKYWNFYSYATKKRIAHYNEEVDPVLHYFNELFYGECREREYEIYDLLHENIWIEYFQKCFTHQKEGWIDFEREISYIIQTLDNAIHTIMEQINKGRKTGNMTQQQLDILRPILGERIPQSCDMISFDAKGMSYRKACLLKDLNRLTRCLEIYLSDCINEMSVSKKLPDIENLQIDKVLSFNYTNTYQRIYNGEGTKKIEYDFIHGKADLSRNVDNCNLVLGIDEYLPDGAKDTDNEFIQFKKFYQRIYKMTGCKYMDWLNDITYNIEGKIATENSMPVPDLHIYIWGHSLDITDKDILSKLINTKGAKTTIFYHDKKALGNQIANLVKIIGQDNLISRVHGSNATIFFREQMTPVNC